MSTVNVGQSAIQLADVPPGTARDLLNVGSFPVLWGTNQAVSPTNRVGTIPVGGRLRLTSSAYLICPGGPGQIEDIPVVLGSSPGIGAVDSTVLILGASIEQNEGTDWPINGTPPAVSYANGLGPVQWANAFSDGKLRIVKNAGLAGTTSAQMYNNFQDPSSVQYCVGITPDPGIIYIGAVCGDDPGTLTPAQSASAWLAIYNLMRKMYPRALVVVCTLPGVNLPAGGNQATRAVLNPVIIATAQTNANTILFDFESIFTNPLTGLPVVAWSGDQIHPNPGGASVLGKTLAALLAPYLPQGGSYVNDYTNDPRVSVANGGWTTGATMPGTPGANTTATGWTFSGPVGATRALVARTDQYGNWQRMTYGGTAGQLAIFRAVGALPAGAQVYCECEVQTHGDWTAGGVTDFSLVMSTSQGGTSNASALGNELGNQGAFIDPGANQVLCMRTPPLTIPAGGSTGGFWTMQLNGTAIAGSVDVGRASLVRIA